MRMRFKYIIVWRGYEIPVIGVIIFLIAAIWASGMVLAPLTLPSDSVNDLTGSVGAQDYEEITDDMNPYAKFYYEAGDFNCHTIKERSFFINGNQMPFCVRDVAIFLGLAFGLGLVLFKRIPLKMWWLIGGLIPIGVDGTVQLMTPYESNNVFRLITGLLAGLVTSLALGYVIYDASRAAEMKRAAASALPWEQEQMVEMNEGGEPKEYLSVEYQPKHIAVEDVAGEPIDHLNEEHQSKPNLVDDKVEESTED